MKRVLFLLMSAIMVFASVAFTGCSKVIEDIDSTKTQLYVANYNGGVGSKWLDDVIERFEEEYEEYEFEPGSGKRGAQVIVEHSKSYDGVSLTNTLNSSDYEVFFTQNFNYHEMATQYLLDITDLVTETVCEQDGKTIFSKLVETDKTDLKINDKIYAIPHYELNMGMGYDAGLFKDKNLYFSDEIDTEDTLYPGTRYFVLDSQETKSPGPDGKYNTYDDGLPSSLMEFYKLIDEMGSKSVTPFVFPGMNIHYTNQLVATAFHNLIGADGVNVNYRLTSNGTPIDIVSGFNGKVPNTYPVALNEDNAYLLRESAGLYYALEFAEKAFAEKANYYTSSDWDNLAAMRRYLNSGLDGTYQYIGMIIDGSYWYNEAADHGYFDKLAKDYPLTYTKKEFKFMPFPRQYSGTVTENNGSAPVMVDSYESFAFIRKGIKSNHIEIAKKFLSFCYSDVELENFTIATNGVKRSLNYDYAGQRNKISNSFAQSLMDMRIDAEQSGTAVKGFSSNATYKANQRFFTQNTNSLYWNTIMAGQSYVHAYGVFKDGKGSAKDYFNGMKIGEDNWKGSYLK